MRKAFTLMEVNLAIMIMAGGILSIVSLYSLGYRENRQSREDVAGAAYAEAVIAPLVVAASSTNLPWSVFSKVKNHPADAGNHVGWATYFDNDGRVNGAQSLASTAFSETMSELRASATSSSLPSSLPTGSSYDKLIPGLVIRHKQGEAVIHISFRAARAEKELLSMPVYYTEVRFQGNPNL